MAQMTGNNPAKNPAMNGGEMVKGLAADMETMKQDLKQDAARVVKDLSSIGQRASEIGREKAALAAADIKLRLEDELAMLKKSLDSLNLTLREKWKGADASIKSHPYAYIAGGLAIGLLMGKMIRSR